MDEFIGIVKLFAGTYAPQGWAFCDGSLLPINQYSAVFALLGTQYGGNGTTTFGLPDLRGRVAVGAGTGPGQQPVQPGQAAGSAGVTLTTQQLPAHTHAQQVSSARASSSNPAGNVLAVANGVGGDEGAVTVNAYGPANSLAAGNQAAIGMTGGNQPVSVMQPYLGMNYIICLQGIFPPRS